MLLPEAVRQRALTAPHTEAFVFPDSGGGAHTVTYGRLHADATSIGRYLRANNRGQGDVVALAFEHGYPVIAGFLGAMYIGAVPAILPSYDASAPDPGYPEQVGRMVRQVQARAVLTPPAAHPRLRTLSGPECLVLPLDLAPGARSTGEAVSHVACAEDPAYVQFTSGSTGGPRGAVIAHRSARDHVAALSEEIVFREGDVSVGWLPLHHDFGLVIQVLLPLAVGGRSVLLAPHEWVRQPVGLMRAVHQYRGSVSAMPNFGFAHCVRRIREHEMQGLDLGSWRAVVCGGEPIRLDTMQRFAERFAPHGLSPLALMAGYGMAENTVAISNSPYGGGIRADRVSRRALESDSVAHPAPSGAEDLVEVVSCGAPVAGTRVGVVDESGAPLPERHVGEIRVRGNALFAGYLCQPGATEAAVRDGWFWTGDWGYMAAGELYVVDRRSDLIITAGRNVSPAEIEAVIIEAHGSDVRRVVAFGVRDDRLGTQLPVAVAELRGPTADGRLARQLREHVRAALGIDLADVQTVPSGWIEVTTSGKVARRANRAKYVEAGFLAPLTAAFDLEWSDTSSPERIEAALARVIGVFTGLPEVDPHAHLSELGLDSLALMEVLLVVEERTGRAVPTEQLALHPTVHHLARLLFPGGAMAPPPPPARGPAYRVPGAERPAGRIHDLKHGGPTLRGKHLLPYGAGTRLLHAGVNRAVVRRVAFRGELEVLERWIEHVPLKIDPQTVIRQSLMINSWSAWRQLALGSEEAFARWVTVRGAEVLDGLAAAGRGTLLVLPHTLLRRLLPRLAPLHGRTVTVVGNLGAAGLAGQGLTQLAGAVARGTPLSRTAVRSAQLMQALRTLAAGGTAVIFADDDEGPGGIEVPFHGRIRPFRPGAAELAVRSGAAFVPVFASMDLEGRITFDFLPAMDPAGPDRASRVRSLLHGYASLLAERYTVELGAMDWYILRKFLDYPAVR